MFKTPRVPVRLTLEVLNSRNLPSTASLTPRVWHATTETAESNSSVVAVVWEADVERPATDSAAAVASTPSPLSTPSVTRHDDASESDGSDRAELQKPINAAPAAGTPAPTAVANDSEDRPEAAATNTVANSDDSHAASVASSPAAAGHAASDDGETDGAAKVAAGQPPVSGTAPRNDDGREGEPTGSTVTQPSPMPATPPQEDDNGKAGESDSSTIPGDSGAPQTTVVPAVPPSDSGSPPAVPVGEGASGGPTGTAVASASPPLQQAEVAPASAAEPAATAVVSESPAAAIQTADGPADLATPAPTAGIGPTYVNAPSAAPVNAPALSVSTTRAVTSQGDRTLAASAGSSSSRIDTEPFSSALTLVTAPVANPSDSSISRTGAELVGSGLTLVGTPVPDGGRILAEGASPEDESAIGAIDMGIPIGTGGEGQFLQKVYADSARLANVAVAEAGLLTEPLQLDSAKLENSIREFLARLDTVDTVFATSPTSGSLYYWLVSAAAATAGASWVLIRRQRNAGDNTHAATNFGDQVFSWAPDGDGNSMETLS